MKEERIEELLYELAVRGGGKIELTASGIITQLGSIDMTAPELAWVLKSMRSERLKIERYRHTHLNTYVYVIQVVDYGEGSRIFESLERGRGDEEPIIANTEGIWGQVQNSQVFLR